MRTTIFLVTHIRVSVLGGLVHYTTSNVFYKLWISSSLSCVALLGQANDLWGTSVFTFWGGASISLTITNALSHFTPNLDLALS